jgi:hypothetical protein
MTVKIGACNSDTATASTPRQTSEKHWHGRSGARVVFNDALAARKAAYEAGQPYITRDTAKS